MDISYAKHSFKVFLSKRFINEFKGDDDVESFFHNLHYCLYEQVFDGEFDTHLRYEKYFYFENNRDKSYYISHFDYYQSHPIHLEMAESSPRYPIYNSLEGRSCRFENISLKKDLSHLDR